jgi:hypothetical protein
VYVEDSCTDLYSLKLVAGDCVTALSLESHHHFSSLRWPLLQYPRPLPDCQPDARPMLDGRNKNLPRLVEIIASVKQGNNMHTIPTPRFDLVEIAVVCIDRVVSLLVGPSIRHGLCSGRTWPPTPHQRINSIG